MQYNETNTAPQPQNTNTSDLVQPEQLGVSPGVAALLSVLIIGLGQMINGQVAKGILMFIGSIAIAIFIGIFVGPFLWIFSGIDAYQCAKKLKNGQPIGKFSFF